jgi:hypothetical protein
MSYPEMIGFMVFLAGFGGLVWKVGSGIKSSIDTSSQRQEAAIAKTNERLAQVVHSLDGLTTSVKEHSDILREHDERLERMEQGR